MRHSRREINDMLDDLKEKINAQRKDQEAPLDLWCDLAEKLENLLQLCSAEDLGWFHDRADELVVYLSKDPSSL